MKILIACEESQEVCKAFRLKGHEAYSCDILDCSGGHPEWHIKGDVLPLLKQKWDMILAFPPCTHLAGSGARYFEEKRKDGRHRQGIEFFCKFLECDCDKVVIENPVGIISGNYIKQYFPDIAEKYNLPLKPTQTIHPWNFGDNYSKKTCLWIKGLPPLKPEITEQPELEWFDYVNWTTQKTSEMVL